MIHIATIKSLSELTARRGKSVRGKSVRSTAPALNVTPAAVRSTDMINMHQNNTFFFFLPQNIFSLSPHIQLQQLSAQSCWWRESNL